MRLTETVQIMYNNDGELDSNIWGIRIDLHFHESIVNEKWSGKLLKLMSEEEN